MPTYDFNPLLAATTGTSELKQSSPLEGHPNDAPGTSDAEEFTFTIPFVFINDSDVIKRLRIATLSPNVPVFFGAGIKWETTGIFSAAQSAFTAPGANSPVFNPTFKASFYSVSGAGPDPGDAHLWFTEGDPLTFVGGDTIQVLCSAIIQDEFGDLTGVDFSVGITLQLSGSVALTAGTQVKSLTVTAEPIEISAIGQAENELPPSLFAEDNIQCRAARYLYIVKHPDASVYWTNHETQISVINLPVDLRHTSPQVFRPVQVQHGEIRSSIEYEARSTTVQVSLQDDTLAQYFLDAPATNIEVTIIRLSSSAVLSESVSVDFDRHCQIIQSGTISQISLRDGSVAAEITPSAFDTDKAIPHVYFERTCNWLHYQENTCKALARDFMLATTVKSLDLVNRTVVLDGIEARDTPVTGTYFRHGYLFHKPTGLRFGIYRSTNDGFDTTLILTHWLQEFAVDDDVEAFAGCDHTTGAEGCAKFSNEANFGGNPYIPNENISIHGATP